MIQDAMSILDSITQLQIGIFVAITLILVAATFREYLQAWPKDGDCEQCDGDGLCFTDDWDICDKCNGSGMRDHVTGSEK